MALLAFAILVLIGVLAARLEAAPLAAGGGDGANDADAVGDDDEDALDAAVTAGARGQIQASVIAGGESMPPTTRGAALAPAAVVAAAYRAAGLAEDPGASWRWRARLAGLVPTVGVRDGRDMAWRGVSDPTIAYVSVFSVTATWRLDRLVFDPNELRVAAIEAGRRRDRRRLAMQVIRTYYAWLGTAYAPRRDELAAELDALTDGWFSQNLPPGPPSAHTFRE